MTIKNNFDYFVNYCYEHAIQLRSHSDFIRMSRGIGKDIDRLQAENDKLRQALEWYADESNYTCDDNGSMIATAWISRLGEKAREIL